MQNNLIVRILHYVENILILPFKNAILKGSCSLVSFDMKPKTPCFLITFNRKNKDIACLWEPAYLFFNDSFFLFILHSNEEAEWNVVIVSVWSLERSGKRNSFSVWSLERSGKRNSFRGTRKCDEDRESEPIHGT